jgi:hypothetical protein
MGWQHKRENLRNLIECMEKLEQPGWVVNIGWTMQGDEAVFVRR